MSDQNEINPYAAPQSETQVVRSAEEKMKRPASVKWALAMMSIAAPVLLFRYVELFAEYGWRLLADKPWGTVSDVFRVAAFFALLFGVRKPWAFWITDVALASNLIKAAYNTFAISGTIPASDTVGHVAYYIVAVLACFHFYRFTFCRPSLTYFRIVRGV